MLNLEFMYLAFIFSQKVILLSMLSEKQAPTSYSRNANDSVLKSNHNNCIMLVKVAIQRFVNIMHNKKSTQPWLFPVEVPCSCMAFGQSENLSRFLNRTKKLEEHHISY
jgi:hypothetical protein